MRCVDKSATDETEHDVGYYTAVRGNIKFSPELSGAEMDEIQEWLSDTDYLDWGGELHSTGFSVEFDGKAYGFENEVRELVSRVSRAQTRSVTGEFVGVGEEQPDVWRLKVSGTTVTLEEAKLVWPDGTEYRG